MSLHAFIKSVRNLRNRLEINALYKSIYHKRSTYRKQGTELQTLKEFMQTAR